jgi:hypothetical protein
MELRCLRGHFLGEVSQNDSCELRIPCHRCRYILHIVLKEGHIVTREHPIANRQRIRIPVNRKSDPDTSLPSTIIHSDHEPS